MLSLKKTLKAIVTNISSLKEQKQNREWQLVWTGSSTSVTIADISSYTEMIVCVKVGDYCVNIHLPTSQISQSFSLYAYFSAAYWVYGHLNTSKSGNGVSMTTEKSSGGNWSTPHIQKVYAR